MPKNHQVRPDTARGKAKQAETQKPDEPKRKNIDWKSISSIISALVKVAEFIRDTILKL